MPQPLDLQPLDLQPIGAQPLDLQPLDLQPLETPSQLESLWGGAQRAGSLGWGDEVAGLGAAAGSLSKDSFLGDILDPKKLSEAQQAYIQGRDEERARQTELKAANPKTYLAGQVLPAIAMPGTGIKALVAQGAVTGLGEAQGGAINQMAGTITGGFLGGLGGVAGQALSKIPTKLMPMFTFIKNKLGESAALQWLYTKAGKASEHALGLDLTKGSREQLARSVGKGKVAEGEIGLDALEKEVVTAGASAKTIANRAEASREAAGEEIKNIVSRSPSLTPLELRNAILAKANAIKPQGKSNLDLIKELKREAMAYTPEVLVKGQPAKYSNVLDEWGNPSLLAPEVTEVLGGKVAASEVQASKQAAGAAADWKLPYADSKAIVNRTLDEQLKGKMPEATAEAYEAANKAYSLSAPAASAAIKKQAADEGKNMFRVGQGVPAAIGGVIGGFPGMATAMAVNQAVTKWGAGVAAGGMYTLANSVKNAPIKFAGALETAAQRGPKALLVTDFLLKSNNPDYRDATAIDKEKDPLPEQKQAFAQGVQENVTGPITEMGYPTVAEGLGKVANTAYDMIIPESKALMSSLPMPGMGPAVKALQKLEAKFGPKIYAKFINELSLGSAKLPMEGGKELTLRNFGSFADKLKEAVKAEKARLFP